MRQETRIFVSVFGAFLLLACPQAEMEAAMTSTNYQILWDSLDTGGDDQSSSSSYRLRDSMGGIVGVSTSTSYSDASGYIGGIYDPTVQFAINTQETATQVAVTALSLTTLTVTTTADFSVGNYVAVVQDEGVAQISALGKVASKTATTLTVDAWTNGGTVPAIDGVNDYAYRLAGTSIALGTLTQSAVTTRLISWEATADVSGGYSVYVFEGTNLETSGPIAIPDVSDGTVSAGSSEHGARSSDTSLALSTFDTQDTGITSTPAQVGSRTDNAFESRDFLTLKTAISPSQTGGAYTQTLTVVFVGDY